MRVYQFRHIRVRWEAKISQMLRAAAARAGSARALIGDPRRRSLDAGSGRFASLVAVIARRYRPGD